MNQFFCQMVMQASKLIHSESFKARNITSEKAFTRNRKLTFPVMISLLLNMLTRTMQIELDDFFFHVLDSSSVTKQAFFKARKSILSTAFQELFELTRNLAFENKKIRRFKGYHIFAIDGSELRLEKNRSNQEYFKSRTNAANNKTNARVSILFDVLSGFAIDAKIGSLDVCERDFAMQNLAYFKGKFDEKDIVIFDRGYPSREIISYLSDMNCKYLMRLQRSAFKGVNENPSSDFRIDIKYHKNTYSVRVVRVILDTGEVETLITNLDEKEFHTNEFKKLYFMRWGVETAFDTLKNKLLIEKFAGRSPIAVMQEFYAMMFILNCLAAMKLTVDRKLKAAKSNCKYSYQGNLNLMIGYFKYRIPMMILSPYLIISTAKILIRLCMSQPVPIISGRSFPRPEFSHQRKVFCPKYAI